MRVVIDMQGAQSESRTRGIGRYSLSLAKGLVRNRGDHEILLALSGQFPETLWSIRSAFASLLPPENFRVWYAPGPLCDVSGDNEARRLRAESIREAFLASLNPDIVHVMSLFEGYGDDAVTSIGAFVSDLPTSVTLHDLIPLHEPRWALNANPAMASWYYRKLDTLKKANLLLTVSQASARDARNILSLEDTKIFNVSAACSEIFQPIAISSSEEQTLYSRLGIDRPFILTSGTIEPHKNLSCLFRAYVRLPKAMQSSYHIVVVGHFDAEQKTRLQMMARIAGLADDNLIITGYVPDDDLVALYNLCTAMVFLSYDEGFGLPVLEGMACGAAVLGGNATSIPEVIGVEDALFNPHDEASVAAKLEQVLTDETFRKSLKVRGLEEARKFSWDKTAHGCLTAMEGFVVKHRSGTTSARSRRRDMLRVCLDNIVSKNTEPDEAQCRALAESLARTFVPDDAICQLFIDVSELSQRDAKTGCQRVTRGIVLELLKNPPTGFKVEPVCATLNEFGYRYAREFTARLLGNNEEGKDQPIDFNSGDIFFGLDYQAQIVPAQQEFLLMLKRHGIPCYFLVHDILPVLIPNCFPVGTELGFRDWLCTIAQFDGVICVSRSTADALREWYQKHFLGLDPQFEIHSVHNGADIENSAPTLGLPEDVVNTLAQLRQRPSFLMVGTIEPRKGHGQALAAFEALWRAGENVNLIIVGKKGWNVDKLVKRLRTHPERNRHLFWLEDVSDEYLEKLYTVAVCLIAASEGEGFGLPLVEAARRKLPILARDIPVFREVAGEHAAYFSGSTAADLTTAVRRWHERYTNSLHPRSDEMPWISWAESAAQMKKLLFNSAKQSEFTGSRF